MKKWWKIIIGLLIIGAALYAMHLWNEKGREKLSMAEAQLAIAQQPVIEKTAKELALEKGKSFFPIPYEWIRVKSSMMTAGDNIGIYIEEEIQVSTDDEETALATESAIKKLGSFELAVVADASLEIVRDIDEYVKLKDAANTDDANLIIVMEAGIE